MQARVYQALDDRPEIGRWEFDVARERQLRSKFHAMTLLKFKLAARVQQRITSALETDSSLA
jgi:deoxyribodipyrimidine photolyase-like uncharacterized protein